MGKERRKKARGFTCIERRLGRTLAKILVLDAVSIFLADFFASVPIISDHWGSFFYTSKPI